MSGPNVEVRPASLNNDANVLIELAGLLEAGRPDRELATEGKTPRSHPEVGGEPVKLVSFAFDQYQDAVALLAALATKLKTTAAHHVEADADNADRINRLLELTQLVPPEQR
ncbi:hypothetical protein C3Y87_02850 [Carbonactinospora thermoautotrophica]|uniref:hypothetical protein n=1 Tax=Carbonactinospora thermoautotrophica TaxID=1469144 RepID=UPI00226D73DF|nr:hypothetical protein [Carbonactinospora thermoautotrophica]MCX9190370.1 hypothetical protein [Carbonactinospora thermoautotrophica]